MDAELQTSIMKVARHAVEERGWAWIEPVNLTTQTHQGEPVWAIRTNAMTRGGNAVVLIRKTDLAVVHTAYLSR